MSFRHYFTFILCLLAGIASAANKTKEKDSPGGEPTNIRFTWWEMPKSVPELYIADGNEKTPVNAYQMAMSGPIKYRGQSAMELVRKVATKEMDKDGKPIFTYVPFLNINLEEVKSKDVAIILFPNEAKGTCQYKLFDFSNEAFPPGSLYIVNYTKAKFDCSIDGKTFSAAPGQKTRCPTVFDERTAAYVAIGTTEPDGTKNLIVSTKLIFSKYFRKLYFITEKMVDGRKEYTLLCIDDASVISSEETSGDKESSDSKKDKSSSGKKSSKSGA